MYIITKSSNMVSQTLKWWLDEQNMILISTNSDKNLKIHVKPLKIQILWQKYILFLP